MVIEKKDAISIRFPMGGVTRRTALQESSPFVCYDALNVFPDCTFLERERGGARPPMWRDYSGPGGPVNLMGEIGYLDSDGNLNRKLLIGAGGKLKAIDQDGNETVASGELLSDELMLTGTALAGKYFIARGADGDLLEYDPITDVIGKVDDNSARLDADGNEKGTLPTNSRMVVGWRDRLWLADGDDPWVITCSRQGDPYDYDFAAGDVQRAVDLSTTRAGRIGQPVIAMIPHTDNCLLVATETEWYVHQGDLPSGLVELITDSLGILNRRAWCHSPDGFLWVMTFDGVYVMAPGCGDPLHSVSREKLPAELVNYDPTEWTTAMCYDHRMRGVHVFMTELSPSAGTAEPPYCGTQSQGSKPPEGAQITVTHFFMDIRTTLSNDNTNIRAAGFWPMSIDENWEPTYALSSIRVRSRPEALLGTRGGIVAHFERKQFTKTDPRNFNRLPGGPPFSDISEPRFASYLMIGPISVGKGVNTGVIESLLGQLAWDSYPVTWEIYAGDDAEYPLHQEKSRTVPGEPPPFPGQQTSQRQAVLAGTWDIAGHNYWIHPRIRCNYWYLLLRSINEELWAFEGAQAVRQHRTGRRRVHYDPVRNT